MGFDRLTLYICIYTYTYSKYPLAYLTHEAHEISQVLAALHREGWELELPEVEATNTPFEWQVWMGESPTDGSGIGKCPIFGAIGHHLK